MFIWKYWMVYRNLLRENKILAKWIFLQDNASAYDALGVPCWDIHCKNDQSFLFTDLVSCILGSEIEKFPEIWCHYWHPAICDYITEICSEKWFPVMLRAMTLSCQNEHRSTSTLTVKATNSEQVNKLCFHKAFKLSNRSNQRVLRVSLRVMY